MIIHINDNKPPRLAARQHTWEALPIFRGYYRADMNPTIFDNFIAELNANIRNNYNTIAETFENEYGWPEVDSVRSEVCKCLICGLNQAAITLTNHLLESVLKKALIIDESAKNKTAQSDITNVFDDATAQFASKNLYENIEQAYTTGLITKEEKDTLHNCRKDYRNAFSHADPQKTFSGISIPATIFTTKDLDNPEEFFKRAFTDKPNVSLSAKNNVIIQGLIQSIKAKDEAVDYFLTIDGIIRNLCSKLFGANGNRIINP